MATLFAPKQAKSIICYSFWRASVILKCQTTWMVWGILNGSKDSTTSFIIQGHTWSHMQVPDEVKTESIVKQPCIQTVGLFLYYATWRTQCTVTLYYDVSKQCRCPSLSYTPGPVSQQLHCSAFWQGLQCWSTICDSASSYFLQFSCMKSPISMSLLSPWCPFPTPHHCQLTQQGL